MRFSTGSPDTSSPNVSVFDMWGARQPTEPSHSPGSLLWRLRYRAFLPGIEAACQAAFSILRPAPQSVPSPGSPPSILLSAQDCPPQSCCQPRIAPVPPRKLWEQPAESHTRRPASRVRIWTLGAAGHGAHGLGPVLRHAGQRAALRVPIVEKKEAGERRFRLACQQLAQLANQLRPALLLGCPPRHAGDLEGVRVVAQHQQLPLPSATLAAMSKSRRTSQLGS